jgi:hypothetical protein
MLKRLIGSKFSRRKTTLLERIQRIDLVGSPSLPYSATQIHKDVL